MLEENGKIQKKSKKLLFSSLKEKERNAKNQTVYAFNESNLIICTNHEETDQQADTSERFEKTSFAEACETSSSSKKSSIGPFDDVYSKKLCSPKTWFSENQRK